MVHCGGSTFHISRHHYPRNPARATRRRSSLQWVVGSVFFSTLKYCHLFCSSPAKCASACHAGWLKKVWVIQRRGLPITSSMIYSLLLDSFPSLHTVDSHAASRYSAAWQWQCITTKLCKWYLHIAFLFPRICIFFPWHASTTVSIGGEFCCFFWSFIFPTF